MIVKWPVRKSKITYHLQVLALINNKFINKWFKSYTKIGTIIPIDKNYNTHTKIIRIKWSSVASSVESKV